MSSGLDLVSQLTPQNADQGLAKAPSTFTDAFSTAMNAAGFAPDDYWNARNAQSDRFQKISDDYFALKGERLLNPYDVSITRDEMRKYPNMPIPYVLQKRLADAREKTRIARDEVGDRGATDPDFLNVDRINTSIAQTGEAMRHANEALVGTGQGVGQFLGGMVGSSVAPHNIAAGMVPVSRLPLATAEGIGRTFLGNVGREALVQGAVQGTAAAAGEAVGYGTRAQFGTAPTAGEITSNILQSTIGGAVFGGTIRATHLGISRLIHGPQVEIRPGEYGPAIDVPDSVKGAAQIMQTADLYGPMNKLGVPEPVHDRAYLSALNDVVAGHGAAIDMELPRPNIHDAVRETHPELMGRYDQLSQTREDLRAQLSPTDETIAQLRQQVEETTAQIQAGPRTQEQAEALGRQAKVREQMLEDAIQRKAALESGAAPEETTVATSLRQQLAATDAEMRDMVGEIRKAYGEHGAAPPEPGEAPPPAMSAEAGQSEPRLTPQENAEVRGLQENLADYHRLMSEASAEDKPAWQAAIDATNERISEVMQAGPEHQPVMQRLVDEVRNPPVEEGRPDFAAAARPTPPEDVAPKTAGVQAAEDKALVAEAQALIERPDRSVAQPLREALAKATEEEADAATAIASCLSGGAL
jgi:hypothetical protein